MNAFAQTITFSYTGTVQTFVIPVSVFSLSVQVSGAQGANATDVLPTRHLGGKGSIVSGVLAVTPGQVLQLFVGDSGKADGSAAYNGGGVGGYSTVNPGPYCSPGYAGGGGGASDIRVGGTALTNRVIVAGGGGGSGRDYCDGTLHPCGCGGSGGPGDGNGYPGDTCGHGCTASLVNYGARGILVLSANAGPDEGGGVTSLSGVFGAGGTGAAGFDAVAGGGGGGGYYGGGGGGGEKFPGGTGVAAGGGGGGSSYVGGVTDSAINPGMNAGQGMVVITAICTPPSGGAISGLGNICEGGHTTCIDSTGSAGGTWSCSSPSIATVGSATGVVTGVSAGTVTISYIVSASCGVAFADTVISVAHSTLIDSLQGVSNVCLGSSVHWTDSVAGGTWRSVDTSHVAVSGGNITGIALGTATITYIVSGTGGCPDTATTKTITVGIPPNTGIITGPSSVCPDSTITLADTVSGGAWSSADVAIGSVSGGVLTGVSAGTVIISYSVSAVCGTLAARRNIIVRPPPFAGNITANYKNAFCIGETINVADTITGGVWAISNNHASLTGLRVTAITAGKDTVLYGVTNSCGTAVDTLALVISLPPPPIMGNLVVCSHSTTTLTDSVPLGTWQSGDLAVAFVGPGFGDAGILTGLDPGTATVYYAIDSGCKTSKVVSVLPIPNVGIINGQPILCKGLTRIFTDSSAGGRWTSGETMVAEIDSVQGRLDALSLGTATVSYAVVSRINGCVNSATLQVDVVQHFILFAQATPVTCYGLNDGRIETNIIAGSGYYHYNWPEGDTAANLFDLRAGLYVMQVADIVSGCGETDSIMILQPDSLKVTPIINNDICNAGSGSIETVVFGGIAPYHFHWSNNAISYNNLNLRAGSYSVILTDSNNCTKSAAYVVKDSCGGIIVHDVITPNGDGINDVWEIEGLQEYPKNTVQVFDKWGNLVYEKTNYNNNWAGQGANGDLLPDGTYFYLVKLNAENVSGGDNIFKGAVLIKK